MSTNTVRLEQSGKRMMWARLEDNKIKDQDNKLDPASKTSRVKAAKQIGVSEEQLFDWITAGPGTYEIPVAKVEPGAVIVRALEQNRENGTQVGSVLDALRAGTPVDQVIDWEKLDQCCCLDVDYHDCKPPARQILETYVLTRVIPRPIAWHFSRSGGLHLFYVAADPFTAEELAAIAALRFRTIDPSAKLELKRMARGPGKEPVHFASHQDTAGINSAWLTEREPSDPDAVAEWCDERSLRVGHRYNHELCPIAPTDDGGKYNKPVMVTDTGIYCFHCAGHEVFFGSRKPGFFPWPALLEHPSTGDVGLMVRNLTHWGHAKWVFTERYGLPESLARIAYHAACKSYHAGKDSVKRIPMIFSAYTADMVRVGDDWRTVDGYPFPKDIQPLLGQLPACATPAAVCLFQQGCDLTRFGLPKIEVINGFKLASVHLPPPPVTHVGRCHPDLIEKPNCLPRYVPRDRSGVKRPGEDWAWDQIHSILPGLDQRFVKLSLCAMASAQETRRGMLPVIFVSGPSGTGKTSTVKAAGGILGAQTADIMFQSDETRYVAAIRTSKANASGLLFNEILKGGSRLKNFDWKQCLGIFLELSETAVSHVLHVGPRKLGKLPACFLSEPAPPPDMRDDTQLARRIRDFRISGKKDAWKDTLAPTGLNPDNLHRLRLAGPDVARACDVILSETIDEFFLEPMSFDDMCKKLGVYTVEDSPEFVNPVPFLRDFFRLVCAAPDLDNPRLAKVYSGGFKQIKKSGDESDTDLAAVYTMFADGPNPPEWTKSRKLEAQDWGGILGVGVPVQLDLRTDSVHVYARFRVGPQTKPTAVNQQIVNPSEWT